MINQYNQHANASSEYNSHTCIKDNDATHGSLALKAYQQNLYLEYYY